MPHRTTLTGRSPIPDAPRPATAGAGCTTSRPLRGLHDPVRSQPQALAEIVLPVLRELTEEVQVERDRIRDTARLPDGTIPDHGDRRAVADLDRALGRARQTIRMLEGVK